MDGNGGQVTEDNVKLFLLLLVLVEPFESIVRNYFVVFSIVIVKYIPTG